MKLEAFEEIIKAWEEGDVLQCGSAEMGNWLPSNKHDPKDVTFYHVMACDYRIKPKCKHKNKVNSPNIVYTLNEIHGPWICSDCGEEGVVEARHGNTRMSEYFRTKKRFGKLGE